MVKSTASKLTPKQQAFVVEYLSTLDATLAAIAAGYSPKTAKMQGRRMLAHSRVAAAIANVNARDEPSPGEPGEEARRSGQDVLADIRAVTREAWNEGDIKTALRGLEMESKLLGMFKSKTEAEASPLTEPILNIPDNERG